MREVVVDPGLFVGDEAPCLVVGAAVMGTRDDVLVLAAEAEAVDVTLAVPRAGVAVLAVAGRDGGVGRAVVTGAGSVTVGGSGVVLAPVVAGATSLAGAGAAFSATGLPVGWDIAACDGLVVRTASTSTSMLITTSRTLDATANGRSHFLRGRKIS